MGNFKWVLFSVLLIILFISVKSTKAADDLTTLASPEAKKVLNQYMSTYTGSTLPSGKDSEGLNMANMMGWIIFGSVGFVAFIYGKKNASWKPLVIGIILMVYPYFTPGTLLLYGVGIVLCLALYFPRE